MPLYGSLRYRNGWTCTFVGMVGAVLRGACSGLDALEGCSESAQLVAAIVVLFHHLFDDSVYVSRLVHLSRSGGWASQGRLSLLQVAALQSKHDPGWA